MRKLALVPGAAAILLAATSHGAEITGTVVDDDPVARTVVVRTADDRTLTVRTDETTRITKGEEFVATTLSQGTPVQVVTRDTQAGEAMPHPLATRILVFADPPSSDDDDTDVDIDTDDDDVDIDTDDDDDDADVDIDTD